MERGPTRCSSSLEHAIAVTTDSLLRDELTAPARTPPRCVELLREQRRARLSLNELATLHSVCALWETNQERIEQLAADVDPPWHRRWRARSRDRAAAAPRSAAVGRARAPLPELTLGRGVHAQIAGSGASRATARSRRYSGRGTSTAPRETRWSVAHCTSSSRRRSPSPRSSSTRADQGDLRRVGPVVEHRLTGEEPADGHAVQPAGQPLARPTPPRCAPSRARAGRRRRRGSRALIHPPGAPGRRRLPPPRRRPCRRGSRSARGRPAERAAHREPVERHDRRVGQATTRPSDRAGAAASGRARGGTPASSVPGSRSAPRPTTPCSSATSTSGNRHGVGGGSTGTATSSSRCRRRRG